jgi:hypothetical protein
MLRRSVLQEASKSRGLDVFQGAVGVWSFGWAFAGASCSVTKAQDFDPGRNISRQQCNVYCTSVDKSRRSTRSMCAFPKDPPARIFINVPAWRGHFDIEIDCIAAVL